jgi:sugar O-acyltransferase (sialic acid O-acetyltransferase NeuD family)
MKVLLIGASGHAKVIIDIIEAIGRDRIVGLTTEEARSDGLFCGYPVLGNILDVPKIFTEYHVECLLVAIGDNWDRCRVASRITHLLPAIEFITFVHPSAQIGRQVEIESGTVVMPGAVVNSGSRVGRHCIINTRASIDHDSVLADCASVGPGATLGGDVRIGHCTAIGIGATIKHRVSIGEHTVIGAGSLVLRDQPGFVVAYGTPARVIRPREECERYL